MSQRSTTVAIDFGEKYVGVALVEHTEDCPNRVLYATTVVIEGKPLKSLVETRANSRRLRRTRKTHGRRLERLREALGEMIGADALIRFCRRRGYGFEPADEQDEQTFHLSRDQFFFALRTEIARIIPEGDRDGAWRLCRKHLNAARRVAGELRPARFENRGRARCQWEGCRHNVPRSVNSVGARLQQALFLWLQPVFAASGAPLRLRKSVAHWVGELAGLAKGLQHIGGRETAEEESADSVVRKRINARVLKVYRNLRLRVQREAPPEVVESFQTNWTEHYQPQLSEIVRGRAKGRVRFCRVHSDEFVEYVLAGRAIPIRQAIADKDLTSRTQQIVFQRLARLVSGRLLPLAGGRIDRVVVERVAFDVLAGPFKARQREPESKAAALYWYGPQSGFASRHEMLEAEFGGRCAYCGAQTPTTEVEHIFQQSDFPFDSYFNVVPACRACNARKGGRTAVEAGMTIHADAYNAYGDYLRRKGALHPYHTIKKGLLNLLRRAPTLERGQQLIGMISDNLVTITNTQRSPRPLARYLATRLAAMTGHRPQTAYLAGRHTALYRTTILPQYDKAAEKEAGELRNHAVDAILLGCRLPSAAALENRRWTIRSADVWHWMDQVRAAGPALQDGLPAIAPVPFVTHFEQDLGNGYCAIELSAFNWNRRRKATHKLDPFGKTKRGVPHKRQPAGDVLSELLSGTGRQVQIDAIAHRTLRRLLGRNPDQAPQTFVSWLQETTRAGLGAAQMSAHPADQERRRMLEEFVNAPLAEFFAAENARAIPWVIGVRCLSRDSGAIAKVNVPRAVNGNPTAQFYQSEAVIKTLYVGYRCVHGELRRTEPVLFAVTQIDEVRHSVRGRWEALATDEGSPLRGRPLGATGRLKDFRRQWRAAFDELCRAQGIEKVFAVTQGCVIEKLDGTLFQLRNFDRSAPWMKGQPFVNIRRVHRSPFRVMTEANGPVSPRGEGA